MPPKALDATNMTYDHLPKSAFPSLVDTSSQYSIAITPVIFVINLFYFSGSGTTLVISYPDFEAPLQILLLLGSGTAIVISYLYFEAPLQIILLSVLKTEGETISEHDGSLTARVSGGYKEQVKEDNALKLDLEEGVHLVESERHSITVEVKLQTENLSMKMIR
ncbi:hypothetical protein NE237_017822 [Protea cynaroides]|uniref:Uncharacterized protein n=1 Tax=Protea cynaroides TaxID=273540 RepID=A0A9Q0K8R5_9MAGN|nr:hypothetical protein NE237_017822 [Protea cynaroides]